MSFAVCDSVDEVWARKARYGIDTSFVKVKPKVLPTDWPLGPLAELKPCFMPAVYQQYADIIAALEVRKDDVWTVTFPRSGTTWTQEMVWLLGNDFDFETAKKTPLALRFPYIDLFTISKGSCFVSPLNPIEVFKEMPSPRYVKTHYPAALLPPQIWTVKPKIIYTARNPKDVATSLFHVYKNLQGYDGTMDEFFDLFLNDSVNYAPICDHILDFWSMRNATNILFIMYEDMKKDLPKTIARVAAFMGKSITEDQIEQLVEHLSFDSMQNNPALNFSNETERIQALRGHDLPDKDFKFIRKGQIGTHKHEMSAEMIKRFDEWLNDRIYGTDLAFDDS